MKEVMGKLQELLGLLEVKVSKVEFERVELANEKRDVAIMKKGLAEKKKDLDAREKAVEETEKISCTIKEAIAMKEEARQELRRIKQKEEDLLKVIEKKNQEVDDKNSAVVVRENKLADAQKSLDADRASYKIKVMENIEKELSAKGIKIRV